MNRIASWVAALCMGLVCSTGQARYAGNDLVVKYRESAAKVHGTPQGFAKARGLAFKKVGPLPRTVVVDGGARPNAAMARLRQDPDVEYVARDRWIGLTSTVPNDPLFGNQYNLLNTGQSSGTPGADIQATSAWDVTTGSASVIVAVSDTGCQIDHPDLASRLWTNPGEIAGNGIDDDGNGYVDDVYGWDFPTNSNSTFPSAAHGTAVSGILGAAAQNTTGIAGVNWGSRVMVLDGFQPSGLGLESDLVNGVVYAIDMGAKVVNQSWGDYDYSPLEVDMALYAQAHGALLVPAAGNEGVDVETYPFYPACLPYDSVLSVGGSDRRDDAISDSAGVLRAFNYGVEGVQISAPAFLIWYTGTGSTYSAGSGTSYAAPQVTGTAGLVLSVAGGLSPAQLKYRLMGTAAGKTGLSERNKTSGRLDANAAVRVQDTVAPGSIGDLAVESSGWNGAVLKFTAPGGDGAGGKASFFQLRVTTGTITTANWYTLPSTPTYIIPSVRGTTEHLLLNELDWGATYKAAVRAVDAAGNAGAISNVVSFAVPVPAMVFQDDCNTSGAWTAQGFVLTEGYAKSGILSWQDSPEGQYAPSSSAVLTGGPFNLGTLSRPRLSFYLRRMFPMNADRGDYLKVEASTDGGASWKVLKRYHGKHADLARESLRLDEVASAATRVRFTVIADSNLVVEDGVYIDDIRIHEGAGAVAEARDVMLETIDFFGNVLLPPDYTTFGSWNNDTVLKSMAPRNEGYSSFRAPAGSAASGQFVPFVPQAGKYEVYATWSSAESASGITYTVQHADGQATRVVDQTASAGNRWVSLGTYRFTYGRSAATGSITMNAATASGQNVRSDAVRLRYAGLDAVPVATAAADWQLFD
jgi:subtilisin family serine protease